MRHPTAKLPKKVVIARKRKSAAAGRKNARSMVIIPKVKATRR